MASILEQFSREFQIPCEHTSRHFVFDEPGKCYDISDAWKHHEFMIRMFNHPKNSLVMEPQIRSTEKTILVEYSIDNGEKIDGTGNCDENEEERQKRSKAQNVFTNSKMGN